MITEGKPKVLLGVTGCIAAYKSCEIIRELQKKDIDVRVVATESALNFVGITTFDALTQHETLSKLFGDSSHPIPHIELALDCDVFLIAPCTANVVAKIVCGIADDLLTSCALAAHDKLVLALAMNTHMYEAPSTQANIKTLQNRGVKIIEPSSGQLACGETGKGKLADVETIVSEAILSLQSLERINNGSSKTKLKDDLPFFGKHILVTAGPTYEAIDDVRFIANRSSGKMGFAIAKKALDLGAKVTLVAGPVSIAAPISADVINVKTACEMLNACEEVFPDVDVAILSAAVADFRPKNPYSGKLKKATDSIRLENIEMVENPDILATLCKNKKQDQYVVGFALEDNNLNTSAKEKLTIKGADMIVGNTLSGGEVFGSDYNSAIIVTKDSITEIEKTSKEDLANTILNIVYANID